MKIEPTKRAEFVKKLEQLINYYSLENGSDTPDYILAEYLASCLEVFNETMQARGEFCRSQFDKSVGLSMRPVIEKPAEPPKAKLRKPLNLYRVPKSPIPPKGTRWNWCARYFDVGETITWVDLQGHWHTGPITKVYKEPLRPDLLQGRRVNRFHGRHRESLEARGQT